jgi:hypothetical protein
MDKSHSISSEPVFQRPWLVVTSISSLVLVGAVWARSKQLIFLAGACIIGSAWADFSSRKSVIRVDPETTGKKKKKSPATEKTTIRTGSGLSFTWPVSPMAVVQLDRVSPQAKPFDEWLAHDDKPTAEEVTTFSAEEQGQLRVHINDGTFSDAKGSPLIAHRAFFVQTVTGDVLTYQCEQESQARRGRPVSAGAVGELTVKEGKLVALSSKSDPYLPSETQLYRFLRFLASQGVDLASVQGWDEAHQRSLSCADWLNDLHQRVSGLATVELLPGWLRCPPTGINVHGVAQILKSSSEGRYLLTQHYDLYYETEVQHFMLAVKIEKEVLLLGLTYIPGPDPLAAAAGSWVWKGTSRWSWGDQEYAHPQEAIEAILQSLEIPIIPWDSLSASQSTITQ